MCEAAIQKKSTCMGVLSNVANENNYNIFIFCSLFYQINGEFRQLSFTIENLSLTKILLN